ISNSVECASTLFFSMLHCPLKLANWSLCLDVIYVHLREPTFSGFDAETLGQLSGHISLHINERRRYKFLSARTETLCKCKIAAAHKTLTANDVFLDHSYSGIMTESL
uniref:Uncharacterized protein n=1 Tax=Parascaris univalens TaxID=6257 RepID=A0A915BQU8_PARUN